MVINFKTSVKNSKLISQQAKKRVVTFENGNKNLYFSAHWMHPEIKSHCCTHCILCALIYIGIDIHAIHYWTNCMYSITIFTYTLINICIDVYIIERILHYWNHCIHRIYTHVEHILRVRTYTMQNSKAFPYVLRDCTEISCISSQFSACVQKIALDACVLSLQEILTIVIQLSSTFSRL